MSFEREPSAAPTASAAMLSSVGDAIPNIVFVADAGTGAVEHVSARFVEYAGRDAAEAMGQGWREIVHPDDLSRAARELRESSAGNDVFRTEVRLLDRHGAHRWHDVRASAMRRPDGTIERWVGTCTDIDELRRSEREQAVLLDVITAITGPRSPDEVLARFASTITSELVDFCAVDLDEVGRARPRRAACALAQACGEAPRALVAALSREERDALVRETSASTSRISVEHQALLAPLVPRSLLVLPLSIGAEHAGHVWLASLGRARPLDERDRRTSEQLVQRLGSALHHARAFDEASRASRMRDEFLAVVSHELRTPLSTVLGWSRLLREDASDPVRLGRGLEVIERSAASQSRIIDDLVDVSRAVSGKLRLDPREVSIAAIARDAVEAVRPTAHEKKIALGLVVEHEARVAVDPDRVRQVMDNLLTNAAKFTPIGGSISLAVRGKAGASAAAEQVEIEVSDSGVGIDPSFLPFVFDRFRLGDVSTTRRHGGLGIGLAIVRAISELHGGNVEAKSAGLGAGATFTVRLPIRTAITSSERVSARKTTSRLPSSELKGVRILVVDDEADARELSSTILSFHGARVATAGSAKDAMRALEASAVDLLLSDIGMPDEDGVSLVRRARAAFPQLTAIALSAYARVEDEERALAAGFARYLTKPVDPDGLVQAVAALASAGRNAS